MDAPEWFTEALGRPHDERDTEVDGCRIRYRTWGDEGNPVAVLVHGSGAHAGWWDHIAPYLTTAHRVIAVDLAGHGDSDRSTSYSLGQWAHHVMAVAAIESGQPPILLGHSMGGFVSLTAATLYGDAVRAVAAIESPLRRMSAEVESWSRLRLRSDNPVYPDREAILGRFRTLPEDAASLPYVFAHLAEGSIREVDGGWGWKFDRGVFFRSRIDIEDLAAATCDIAMVRGQRGMDADDLPEFAVERLGRPAPVTVIPDAGHHLMLDQPLALIATLQTLLGQWTYPSTGAPR